MKHLLSFFLFVSFLSPSSFAEKSKEEKQDDRYRNLELFQKVLQFVEVNYVDEGKVSNQKLIYGALKGMLDTLDPHSNFLPPELFRDLKADTSGKFGGLGIELGMKDDVPMVISPIEDSPAWKAGIQSNDRIVKINGESTKGLSLADVVSKMRGKKGTVLRLTIQRDSFKVPKEFKIVRADIKMKSVRFELLENKIAYVRLTNFNENAAKDILYALQDLSKKQKNKKLEGLILDLRNNPGGLLDQAVDLVSLFVKEGRVVSTRGRPGTEEEVRSVRPVKEKYLDIPILVLVNSGSASASEIVAGALQDHKRALVVGQTTFGKGSVQSILELGDDVGLKLTIAKYYTPSGRDIQELGVKPDLELDEYDLDLLEKAKIKKHQFREVDLKGHILNSKKISKKEDDEDSEEDRPSRFDPSKDYQILESVKILKNYEYFKKREHEGSQR